MPKPATITRKLTAKALTSDAISYIVGVWSIPVRTGSQKVEQIMIVRRENDTPPYWVFREDAISPQDIGYANDLDGVAKLVNEFIEQAPHHDYVLLNSPFDTE